MSFLEADERDQKTHEAMLDPQPGDRFQEMCSFYLYVVAVEGDIVTTMEGSPPVTFPGEGKVKTQTREEFIRRFAYGGIPGYWVILADRGNDVSGWLAISNPSPVSYSQTKEGGK